METQLTKGQAEVLQFLKDHQEKNGYQPTREEISEHFGWRSANAAQSYLTTLESKGFIRVVSGKSRAITILKEK